MPILKHGTLIVVEQSPQHVDLSFNHGGLRNIDIRDKAVR